MPWLFHLALPKKLHQGGGGGQSSWKPPLWIVGGRGEVYQINTMSSASCYAIYLHFLRTLLIGAPNAGVVPNLNFLQGFIGLLISFNVGLQILWSQLELKQIFNWMPVQEWKRNDPFQSHKNTTQETFNFDLPREMISTRSLIKALQKSCTRFYQKIQQQTGSVTAFYMVLKSNGIACCSLGISFMSALFPFVVDGTNFSFQGGVRRFNGLWQRNDKMPEFFVSSFGPVWGLIHTGCVSTFARKCKLYNPLVVCELCEHCHSQQWDPALAFALQPVWMGWGLVATTLVWRGCLSLLLYPQLVFL